jgi:hypothetical protein
MLAPSVAAAAAPTVVCTVQDERLPKISGVAAVSGGYVVVDKEENGTALRLYKLDPACKPSRILNDADDDPFSPQDLAATPDGTLWVADVGDDQLERATAAVHKVPTGATKAQKYRLQYPDGKHNAAALIMQPNGVPVIITKEAGAVAKLYTTAAPLATLNTVKLVAAGTLTMPASTTSGGPVGPGGRTVVTGATLSPDGKKVLVRTYTDAYEWDVTAAVPAALQGKPRHTPLPDEAAGEAITYTSDGLNYVTLSARSPSQLLEWTPAAPPAASTGPKAGAKKADTGGGFSFTDLSLKQLGGVVLGVGALGLILLVAGIVGIVRFRRQATGEDELDSERRPGGPRPGGAPGTAAVDGEGPGETVSFPRVGGSVYGGSAAGPVPAEGGKGTVYGGGGSGDRAGARRATVYGAPAEAPAEAPSTPDRRPAEPVPSSRGTVYGGTTYGSGTGGREAAEPRSGGAAPRSGGAARAATPPPPGRSGPPPASRTAPPPGPPRSASPPPGPPRSAGPPPAGPARPAEPPVRPSAQGRPAGTTYGGNSSAGAPPPEPPERAPERSAPPREPRDWRSRKPRD